MDFDSAVSLSNALQGQQSKTNHSSRHNQHQLKEEQSQLVSDPYWHVWRDFFQNLGFSPEDLVKDDCDTPRSTQVPFKAITQRRHKLLERFYQPTSSLWQSHGQLLPIQTVSPLAETLELLPRLPLTDTVDNHNISTCPGPASYFGFISTATSPEWVVWDPYSHTLSVRESIVQDALLANGQSVECHDHYTATLQAMSHTNGLSSPFTETTIPKAKQILWDMWDTWNISPQDYGLEEGSTLNDFDNDELELTMVHQGVACKKAVRHINGQVMGTMVVASQKVSTEEMLVAYEIMTWYRDEASTSSKFGPMQRCRLPGPQENFLFDVCPVSSRILATMSERNLNNDTQTDAVTKVGVYPLGDNGEAVYASPEYVLDCNDLVTALVCPPTGRHLLIATATQTIHLWDISNANDNETRKSPVATFCLRDKIQIAMGDNRYMHEEGVRSRNFLQETSIQQLLCAPYGTMERFGFVSVHASHENDNDMSLVVWSLSGSTAFDYKVCGMIHLPLCATHQVHYDGHRLLVLGQDHLGTILLVYHVGDAKQQGHDGSGGVVSLENSCVRFVNRIRHSSLHGKDLRMSCNERFLLLSTTTTNSSNKGHEGENDNDIHPTRSSNDGLLIFDLESEGLV